MMHKETNNFMQRQCYCSSNLNTSVAFTKDEMLIALVAIYLVR
jgi:hypothetical protein